MATRFDLTLLMHHIKIWTYFSVKQRVCKAAWVAWPSIRYLVSFWYVILYSIALFYSGPKTIWQQNRVQPFHPQWRAHLLHLMSPVLGNLPTMVTVSRGKGTSNSVLSFSFTHFNTISLRQAGAVNVLSVAAQSFGANATWKYESRSWKSYAFILNDMERCSLFFLHEHFDGYVMILY